MTVEVHYHQDRFDMPKTAEFPNEQQAPIFIEGLRSKDDCSFDKVKYPDSDRDNASENNVSNTMTEIMVNIDPDIKDNKYQ